MTLSDYNGVAAVVRRVAGYANKTPMMTSRAINEESGAEVFFKCEDLQRMGAFKPRDATNALRQSMPQQCAAGVVTFPSGNHAQAVAPSAKLLGIPTTTITPHDTPTAKVATTKGYSGRVINYDRYTEGREKIGRDLAEKQGLTLIPPYDHPHMIADQGIVTRELIEEVGQLDILFVCLGGGSLFSGSVLTTRHLPPDCIIYDVEPETDNGGQQSFRSGKIVHIDTSKTITGGAQTQYPGNYTFQIIRQGVNGILTVSDAELIVSVKSIAKRMKVVIKLIGCLGFTAARARKAELHGKKIDIIIGGGNADISRYSEFLAG